ncbi:polysaccharide deacetylase family protein [Flavobacteriaceae bacterium F89]|uniref:Polysaccharide deacetylase family protein n=1 Tax=Cerina litoralis TaxID=2874477 RepID=A0AAE3JS15_9FLAO|nr:polysaccharide deacetylase family protein [Cerina litoralis]MCG2460172.1 polysaccharide deacetylase family protein [Cerina litoralis]
MLRFKTVNFLAVLMILLLVGVHFFVGTPWWSYLLLAILWLTLTTVGSFHMRWNYHLKSLNSNPLTKKNCVSLTFDDGPNPEFTPQILTLLKKHKAKATFFCIGKNIEENTQLFQEILAQGHTVGNHTYSHANSFGFFSTQKVVEELMQTNRLANKISGMEMKLYRPAFGVTNPSIAKALQVTKLQSIGWSIRSLDTTKSSEETILKRITDRIYKGDIVLLHDSSEKSVKVLERLLLFLQANHLESVTVDQLLEIEAYA